MYIYDTLSQRNTRFYSWDEAYNHWYHNCSASNVYEYYVVDTNINAWVPFRTEKELAAWWKENGDSDLLNVTGNDIRIYREPYIYDEENKRQYYREYIYIRRWQVIDKYGRKIDIRNFDIENADLSVIHYPSNHLWLRWLNSRGKKNRRHSKTGAFGYKRSLIHKNYVWDEDTVQYKNMVKIRKRIRKSDLSWDYFKKAHATDFTSSKCWKDQCRANRQYWKYKCYRKNTKPKQRDPEPLEIISERIFTGS